MLDIVALEMAYPLDHGVHQALKGIDVAVAPGEFFTLLGPSGCGKTTALRSVAGLETPTGGRIAIDGRPVFSHADGVARPPARRDISMVFQSYAIWPHMTVGGNVSFPLEAQRVPAAERRAKVAAALEMGGLGAYADRPATQLSGGQQQRVALARAIVKDAKVLLLDEPLSNLDAKLREQMRAELRALQERIGTTSVYVTHDQDEALSLSDRIAVMRLGEVLETGAPEDLYLRPRTRFTAEFVGQAEVLPGRPAGPRGAGFAMDTALGDLVAGVHADLGQRATAVMIRPEHIALVDAMPAENAVRGRIAARGFSGRIVEYRVETPGGPLVVQATSATMRAVGSAVILHLPPERCVLLPAEG